MTSIFLRPLKLEFTFVGFENDFEIWKEKLLTLYNTNAIEEEIVPQSKEVCY